MKLFDRVKSWFRGAPQGSAQSQRASRRVIMMSKVGTVDSSTADPVWTQNSMGTELVDRLTATVWVFACVSVIASTLSSIPLRVMVDGEIAPDDDPLAKLLKHPAPKWSYPRFARACVFYLELTGSAYVQKVRTMTAPSAWEDAQRLAAMADATGSALDEMTPQKLGAVDEVWVYGQDEYETDINETQSDLDGFIRPYVKKYVDKDSNEQPPWDVIQILYTAPGEGFEGLGIAPYQAAEKEVKTDVAAVTFQGETFNNRAVPHGVWQLVADVSDEQYEELETFLRGSYEGAQNAGKGMLLGSEVKYVQLAQNAVDMAYKDGRKLTREGICAAFNVPPPLVGILDRATYSNMSQAELLLWKLKVLPLLSMLIEALNTELAPEFGPTHKIEADLSNADALLPIIKEKLTIAKMYFDMGVPVAQISQNMHLGIQAYPGWEVGLVPGNLVPVSMLSEVSGEE